MKIAWFTPFSRTSAIGQYSSVVVKELSQYADVTVYVSDTDKAEETWLPEQKQLSLLTHSPDKVLHALYEFEVVIYNLGDNYLLHGRIFEICRRHSGIIILHDLVMHHFFSGYYFLDKKDQQGYVKELEYSHGVQGRDLGRRVIDGHAGNIWEDSTMLDYHMAKSALHGCQGVVTHSRFAQDAIEEFAAYPVIHINFPSPALQEFTTPETQQHERTHFLSFGMLNSNKMIDQVISTIGQHPTLREKVVYNIIGKGEESYVRKLRELIERYELDEVVYLLGYQPDETLHKAIYEADVIINLRNPHFGESSWVLLETAFAGKPTMVWKHGYYDEYPDVTVAKVTEKNLSATLEQLARNRELRERLGNAIKQYAHENFRTQDYCRQLLDFVQVVQYHKPWLALTDFMSEKIVEIAPDNSNLAQLVFTEISNLSRRP
jgi:glycosyltransferase involved in cell wall biosynthesis